MTTDTVATLGRWQRAAGAPRGLRRYLKLGEIDRAMGVAAEWREHEARIAAARDSMVRDLRGRGCSWDGIGWLLGQTGEAVRARYGGGSRAREG